MGCANKIRGFFIKLKVLDDYHAWRLKTVTKGKEHRTHGRQTGRSWRTHR